MQGAADCVGVYENKETIIDFKQSNKPKKDEWIEDYYSAMCAYALAHDKLYMDQILLKLLFYFVQKIICFKGL